MTLEFFLLYFSLGHNSWLVCRFLLENNLWLKRMILVLKWSWLSIAIVVVSVYETIGIPCFCYFVLCHQHSGQFCGAENLEILPFH